MVTDDVPQNADHQDACVASARSYPSVSDVASNARAAGTGSLPSLEAKTVMAVKVPAAELQRAKDHLKGSLMLSLENTASRMSHLARQEIYFDRQFGLDETLQGVERAVAEGRLLVRALRLEGEVVLPRARHADLHGAGRALQQAVGRDRVGLAEHGALCLLAALRRLCFRHCAFLSIVDPRRGADSNHASRRRARNLVIVVK